MINKWLDRLEEKLNSDYDEDFCGVATTLFTLGYPMDVWCLDCDEDNQKLCKAKAQEIIGKIREEWKWYQVELARKIKFSLENKQATNEETIDKTATVEDYHDDVLGELKALKQEFWSDSACNTCDIQYKLERLGYVFDCATLYCSDCREKMSEYIKACIEKEESKQTNTHSDVLNKLLDSMIARTVSDDCCVRNIINEYDGLGFVECDGECVECEEKTIARIEKIREELEKQAISDKTSDKEETLDKKQLREFMEQNKADNVNHPTHYKVHKHECIDEMVAVFGVEDVKAFCKCNAWKYRYRSSAKNGEEDLKKADWYLEKLIELETGETE